MMSRCKYVSGDIGEGRIISQEKLVTSFMDGPILCTYSVKKTNILTNISGRKTAIAM